MYFDSIYSGIHPWVEIYSPDRSNLCFLGLFSPADLYTFGALGSIFGSRTAFVRSSQNKRHCIVFVFIEKS